MIAWTLLVGGPFQWTPSNVHAIDVCPAAPGRMVRGQAKYAEPMPPSLLDRVSSAFAGLIDGLCDPARRRRVALGVVVAYAAVWTLYGVIAKSSQDINADMAEMVVWAREPALGYPKHPPLLAYVVKLWFSVFPFADWAFTLLAVVTVAAGVYLACELAGIWLVGAKRAAVPFLLMVIPFYNFLGLKFDQNSALIPLWALAMWSFLRSLQSGHAGWAALAGLAVAAAMLTKYWSVFLVAALALAALADHRRGAYFRTAAPWVTAFVFVLIVLPHAVWLVQENFPPLTWITSRRGANSVADLLRSFAVYIGGTVGYAALSLLLVAFLFRPPHAATRDSWFVWDAIRRPATILFWTPLVLPIVASFTARTNLQSIWNAPALNLLPVMMLMSSTVVVSRIAVGRLAAIVTALTLVILACSPLVAFAILKIGVENNASYTRLAAAAAERLWRETSDRPLRLVAGPFTLASSAAFYIADEPSAYSDFSRYLSPWVDDARLAREGVAIICPADDVVCLKGMDSLAARGPAGKRTEVTLTRHWLGFDSEPRRFVIATVPPRP
jgi:4-amino-4-deoxy-L-arabinose transferase-like glycosyltransferase